MQNLTLQSGWESFLLAVPLVGMVLLGVFRLDAIAAAPKHEPDSRRPPSGVDKDGEMLLTDPDGHPWDRDHGGK